MADKTSVANLALSKLGEDDQLTNVDIDDSHCGRSIRAVFDTMRQAVLRQGKFNFSLSRAELVAQNPNSVPAPPSSYPYDNRFPLPAGFLRLVEVIAPCSVVDDYKMERGAILANSEGPVHILYVADVVETGLWDPLFVEAFASRLAFQVADRITGDRGRKADCWQQYRDAMREASGVDAKEDPPTETPDSDWVTSRYG